MTDFHVRPADDADLPEIAVIYAHHVLNRLASFEIEPPSTDALRERRAQVLHEGLPYLVAAGPDRVLGFCYAAPYRARAAYAATVEDSVYVAPDAVGRGIGRALLDACIAGCIVRGKRQMIAVIGDSANVASVGLHRAAGFRHAGTLSAVGWKHGRWIDSVLMQRGLGTGASCPPASAAPMPAWAAAFA